MLLVSNFWGGPAAFLCFRAVTFHVLRMSHRIAELLPFR
jgi:hypothetical protein